MMMYQVCFIRAHAKRCEPFPPELVRDNTDTPVGTKIIFMRMSQERLKSSRICPSEVQPQLLATCFNSQRTYPILSCCMTNRNRTTKLRYNSGTATITDLLTLSVQLCRLIGGQTWASYDVSLAWHAIEYSFIFLHFIEFEYRIVFTNTMCCTSAVIRTAAGDGRRSPGGSTIRSARTRALPFIDSMETARRRIIDVNVSANYGYPRVNRKRRHTWIITIGATRLSISFVLQIKELQRIAPSGGSSYWCA